MALFVVDCGRLVLMDDPTQIQAEVTVQTRVGSTTYPEFTTNVVVATGSSVSQTNNNILTASLAVARTTHGLTVNQGGADRSGMTGGRTL